MHEQNLRQRLAIKGSKMTNTVQNDDNRQTSLRFDPIVSFFNERFVNFAPIDTRHEGPMEIDHARNNRRFR